MPQTLVLIWQINSPVCPAIENRSKTTYTDIACSKFIQRRKGYHHAQAFAR
jgi:hypothetical protein